MDRLVLSDSVWERMAPLIIDRDEQKGSIGRDNRMFVETMLWNRADGIAMAGFSRGVRRLELDLHRKVESSP